ncbi:MAG: hypothetical protein NXI32_17010 [bacterium]|nr:hypothetical protein [bacterium]
MKRFLAAFLIFAATSAVSAQEYSLSDMAYNYRVAPIVPSCSCAPSRASFYSYAPYGSFADYSTPGSAAPYNAALNAERRAQFANQYQRQQANMHLLVARRAEHRSAKLQYIRQKQVEMFGLPQPQQPRPRAVNALAASSATKD